MPIPRQPQGFTHSPATDIAFSRTLLLATDLQQSILAELDRSGPNHLAYTAYGSQSGQRTAGSHLGFNGQLRERPTGWSHLGNGHRVYNPVLMRFHSPDQLSPFGKGGVNAYAYCAGDPLNYTDPTGEFVEAIFQIAQRGLLVALHTVIPAGMMFGPKVSGVGLLASRVSGLGSMATAGGAIMHLVESPYGLYVITGGTIGLLVGATVRGAVAVKAASKNKGFWKTGKDNFKNLIGWSDSAKVVEPPVPLTAVRSDLPAPSISNQTPSGVSNSPKAVSRDIRQS